MRVLLTGGSACGKSTFAESLAVRHLRPRYYIATMRPYGEESLAKIERHRNIRRHKGFETVERYTDIAGISFPKRGVVLLECLCNLTANEMFDENGHYHDVFDDIIKGIASLEEQSDTLIVVTNDVGSDINEYQEGTLKYIEALGRLNAAIASRFDLVAELVCGIPVVLKGEPIW